MTAGLGIRIGSVTASAALDDGTVIDGSSMPMVTRRSALDIAPGHPPRLASPLDRPSPHELTSFADRVGDPVPLIDNDGNEHTGEDLFATAARCLVDELAAGFHTGVVVAHPARWPRYTVDILDSALQRAGIPDATLVPDSLASMRWLESTRGEQDTGLTVVYDLGSSALDVALVRTGADGGIVGTPVHSEDIGGAQFDHLTMQYVLETASSSDDFEFDPFDPDTVGALVELRARCTDAKEALSSDTATALRIQLPGIDRDVRLVRSEFEDLVRAPLLESIEYVREALRTAGLGASDVTQILLTGGSAAIPLVAELMSAEFKVPVVAGPNPGSTAAIGAAAFAYDIVNAETFDNAAPLTEDADPVATGVAAALADERVRNRARSAAPPFTSPASGDKPATSGKKKAGIVVGAVAVLAILAGGGLGVGTALTSNDTPPQSSIETSNSAPTSLQPASVAPVAGTTAAPSVTGVVDANGTSSSGGSAGSAVGATGSVPAGSAGTGTTGSSGAAGNAGAAPATQAPAAQAPAAQAPAAQAPAAGNAAPAAPAAPALPPAPVVPAPNFTPPSLNIQVPQVPQVACGLPVSNPLCPPK